MNKIVVLLESGTYKFYSPVYVILAKVGPPMSEPYVHKQQCL